MPAPRKSLFSSLASSDAHTKLPEALLIWVKSLPSTRRITANSEPSRRVESLQDLVDGVVLGQVLLDIDPTHFDPLSNALSNSKALSENWVLRFNHLKRLYKLLIRYFEDVLSSSTTELLTPNLQLIAKSTPSSSSSIDDVSSLDELLKLLSLILALTVQSEHRLSHIERIQGFEEWVQRELMVCIEQVMSKVSTLEQEEGRDKTIEIDADTEFYQIQHEKSRLVHDKEALQTMYQDLLEEHHQLKEEHEEALSTTKAFELGANELEKESREKETLQTAQGYKTEIDRLRNELQSTSNQLGESEMGLEKQTRLVQELTKKVDELTPLALSSTKLKDQLDEYKHSAEKLKKLENVLDKYKKKVEDSSEYKRVIKTLERENEELLEKVMGLEEEKEKVGNEKGTVEGWKVKCGKLEEKVREGERENERLRGELERVRDKLKEVEELRVGEREGAGILEERLKELELGDRKGKGRRRRDEDDSDDEGGVGAELDDALAGTSTTDLKLRIRKLERQLQAGSKGQGDQDRVGILEKSLEDAKRMKDRYEGEYLKETRERTRAERKLEEIMSGKSKHGRDGLEAVLALRQRLDETVAELGQARERLARVEDELDTLQREHNLAKSNLSLVGKDQLEMLHSLRASVSIEKDALVSELQEVKTTLRLAEDKARLHREEINSLLQDKIELQGDGITQRERLIEREKEFGSASKGTSEADRKRFEEETSTLQNQIQSLEDKLQKAKAFIKSQDKLLKAELSANYEETIQAHLSQISQLTEDLTRQKSMAASLETNYQREHELILSAWHDTSMRHLRQQVLNSSSTGSTSNGTGGEREYQPQSWIKQQRLRANGKPLRNA